MILNRTPYTQQVKRETFERIIKIELIPNNRKNL